MVTALSPKIDTDRNMLSVQDAEQCIRENMQSPGVRNCPLEEAVDSVLHEDIKTDRDLPPYDRITMDGIAVSQKAVADDRRTFSIQAELPAGHEPPGLASDSDCIEVMTGAVLPPGCDCVIPVERIEKNGTKIRLADGYSPRVGQHIHRKGSDYAQGTVLLKTGLRLRAPDVAVLASVGKASVSVAAEPEIGIITTGDELVEVGAEVKSHQVRRSNDRVIAAALRHRGHICITRSHVSDDPAQIEHAVRESLDNHSVLILSGGVSMGKYDYLPAVLDKTGVRVVFHKISQRPGKPMWFGVGPDGQSVFALPGNPVSVAVCMRRFVLPAISFAMGADIEPELFAILSEDVEFKPELTWFLPICVERHDTGQVLAVPRPTNTSGDFATLSSSDGFIELEKQRQHFPRGYAARYFGW